MMYRRNLLTLLHQVKKMQNMKMNQIIKIMMLITLIMVKVTMTRVEKMVSLSSTIATEHKLTPM